jgi:serine/threonine protein kinase
MAEQPPKNAGQPEPPGGEPVPRSLDVEAILGHGIESTDDAPTIISKAPPTQSFLPVPATDSPINGSIRGRTLAHFELLDPIGVGGMAAVIRARDKLLDRIVALKILPPDMATDVENVKRFHQEARAAAKLDHENIARVYFCGEDQKLHFIAFEFVEGQNLRTLLERRGRLPVAESVHYMLQIATGLAHAAARGVVHRDIKPSNIIITPSGRAKLVDMGLARSLAPHDPRQLTQSGVTLGTFDYISPEQALEPRDADVRSDIYSLGCTFYHLLTGQPPVPEGTAAKKLHHHQQVAPIDPRQLNPEIPDEVTAILQRMMAKDPKERYQRAEHLVQHLLQVAQKLGGVEVPDGVLFVDAPLPNPPRKRPVLLGVIGAVALALFVFIVSLATPHSPILPLQHSKGAAQAAKDDFPIKQAGPGNHKEAPAVVEKRVVANERELVEALADDKALKQVILAGDLQLNESAVAYHGLGKRNLVVESLYPEKPATIKLVHTAGEDPVPFGAGITVEGGSIVFKHIRFEIETPETPHTLLAGVVVKAGHATFESCTFIQHTPAQDWTNAEDLTPVASVAAWEPGLELADRRPSLLFKNCYFSGGQAAVSVKGAARVEQSNCAVGPHACVFHVWGQDKDKDDLADVRLVNVSALVTEGPVFRLDENISCKLNVEYSLLSCPEHAGAHDHAQLIRQTTPTLRAVRFDGKHNVYHNLAAFWVRPSGKDQVDEASWDVFKTRIAQNGGTDATSLVLSVDPWSKNPLTEMDPQLAFRIKEKLPELRRPDQKNRPLGVETCAWGPVYPTGLENLETRPADPVVKLGPNERLVDPSGKLTGARIHKKLESAISEADAGDVILIKHNGSLPVEPSKLTDRHNVKLKPYGEYHPILVLGKSADKDAALFHLHQSQLEFEHLEIVLHAEENRPSLAVVNLGEQSICQFKQCTITLDAADYLASNLVVVTLLDPRETMKMGGGQVDLGQRPEVHFSGCLIRGKGDVLNVRASRAFDVDVEKSLICLAGSLLTCKANTVEPMPLEARATIRLNRTTTYMTEPLLMISCSSKSGKGLAFTQVESSNCLFVSAAGKPLVRLDGPEGEMQMKKLLAWTGPANAYSGFDKILDVLGSDSALGVEYYKEDWRRFTDGGDATHFVGALFQPEAGTERVFSKLKPDDFRLKSDASVYGYGAVVNDLPAPAGEMNGADPHSEGGAP